ncbi:MAG: acyl-CoA dehydratase activase-related protein [Candidatus Helarchaeales archaeon]
MEHKGKKKVGIPRSLLFFKYYPLWKIFLEELGFEIVLSDRTNSKIVEIGGNYAIDEICIPLKLYYGHVLNLLEKDIDYLFVPRYISTTFGTYMCPKFLGLPDMVRGTLDNLPPIIELEIDLRKKPKFYSAFELGRKLSRSTRQIRKAYEKAIKGYHKFRELMMEGLTFEKALSVVNSGKWDFHSKPVKKDYSAKIALIGHGYNIYDDFINMNLLKKLKEMNVNVITLENLPVEIFHKNTVISKTLKNYWGNEEEILSAMSYLYEDKEIDGIIFICSFCCGPDSLIDEIITRDTKKLGIPYICLVLDEHSGQAGVITRIEAFVDMIIRKKKGLIIASKSPTIEVEISKKINDKVGA